MNMAEITISGQAEGGGRFLPEASNRPELPVTRNYISANY